MRREHVVDGWWMMPGTTDPDIGWPGTKNGKDHRVFLSPLVQRIIADLSNGEATGFVLATERGGPVSGLDADMRKICLDTGIAGVRPHDLRRTFGTTVTGLGLGRPTMDRLLNHADHSIGSVYDQHAYRREDQAAWERVAGHIMSLVDDRVAADNVVQFAPPA
jgi:integrase